MSNNSFKRKYQNTIKLDSLTDIIANSIGVILFILLFAVLGSRTTYFNLFIPTAPNADDATGVYVPIAKETVKSRKQFLCSGNTLIPLDFQGLYNKLSVGVPKVTFDNFPNIVSMLNNRKVDDDYLEARLMVSWFEEDAVSSGKRKRDYREQEMIIKRKTGAKGDALDSIDLPSSVLNLKMRKYDTEKHWIVFFVENDSIEIFRKAREIAWRKGFDVGWEPTVVNWPKVINLMSDSGKWELSPNINQGGNK